MRHLALEAAMRKSRIGRVPVVSAIPCSMPSVWVVTQSSNQLFNGLSSWSFAEFVISLFHFQVSSFVTRGKALLQGLKNVPWMRLLLLDEDNIMSGNGLLDKGDKITKRLLLSLISCKFSFIDVFVSWSSCSSFSLVFSFLVLKLG